MPERQLYCYDFKFRQKLNLDFETRRAVYTVEISLLCNSQTASPGYSIECVTEPRLAYGPDRCLGTKQKHVLKLLNNI